MDALYFRVSSDRQTTENQFDELITAARIGDPARDWDRIRGELGRAIVAENRPLTAASPGPSTRSTRRSRAAWLTSASTSSKESPAPPASAGRCSIACEKTPRYANLNVF